MLLKAKTGHIQTDEGGVNTQYKSNNKQKMGTYAINIYGNMYCIFVLLSIVRCGTLS
jgi:hypothetical protein